MLSKKIDDITDLVADAGGNGARLPPHDTVISAPDDAAPKHNFGLSSQEIFKNTMEDCFRQMKESFRQMRDSLR